MLGFLCIVLLGMDCDRPCDKKEKAVCKKCLGFNGRHLVTLEYVTERKLKLLCQFSMLSPSLFFFVFFYLIFKATSSSP